MVVVSPGRVIRYVCVSRAHVRAPEGAGYVVPYGFAEAWCPSIEADDHEFLQIKDMHSRIAELATVLDALRNGAPAEAWDKAVA